MINLKNIEIISGGQSGVDRAALDFALQNNIKCGGYCPKGRLAEDGIIDKKYPLLETQSSIYKERTRLNIEQSDAVLVIYEKDLGIGTKLTIEISKKKSKSIFIAKLPTNKQLIEDVIFWLNKIKPTKLNIVGPRESTSEGIYDKTYSFLSKVSKLNTFESGLRLHLKPNNLRSNSG